MNFAPKQRPPEKQAARKRRKALELEVILRGEKRKIAKNVLFDAIRLGFGVEKLQLGNDLLHAVAAVAALDDF